MTCRKYERGFQSPCESDDDRLSCESANEEVRRVGLALSWCEGELDLCERLDAVCSLATGSLKTWE